MKELTVSSKATCFVPANLPEMSSINAFLAILRNCHHSCFQIPLKGHF